MLTASLATSLKVPEGGLEAGAIDPVAQKRMADMCHVHTDLWVRPVFQDAADRLTTGGLPNSPNLVVGDGFARHGRLGDGHFLAVAVAAAGDIGRNRAAVALGNAPDDGLVGPFQPAITPVGGELLGRP